MAEQKFYRMSIPERLTSLTAEGSCKPDDLPALSGDPGLTAETADRMIENVIGTYALPMGIAQHFVINGKQVPIPMVIEEPSVVAAASNAAGIAAKSGGFRAEADTPCMIGQVQLLRVPDLNAGKTAILAHKNEILEKAGEASLTLRSLGGGPKDLEVRTFPESACGPMLVVHLILDVRDAMGANAIDTALERIAPLLEECSGGEARLRILSNLADRRLARAFCVIPPEHLAFKTFRGEDVRDRMLEAAAFAEVDPYRAVTANKGIMNGIDAVLLAVGNDWRAVEAGAHAWAARSGEIRPLAHWSTDAAGNLCGKIELPMAVGTVGGATKVHPGAAAALRLIGPADARELAGIIAAVGLAQNMAAIKALSTEGIQKGHMSLHAKQLAISAGAAGSLIDEIAARMVSENKVSAAYAKQLVGESGTQNGRKH